MATGFSIRAELIPRAVFRLEVHEIYSSCFFQLHDQNWIDLKYTSTIAN
jgi:hypothetical protein